jgi:hypothetical protein
MDAAEARIIEEIGNQFKRLLSGENAEMIVCDLTLASYLQELCKNINEYLTTFNQMRAFIKALAEGNLEIEPPRKCLIASPFKQLQASLKHLTWQTRCIAEGDLSQRVHFMGDFSTAFNSMVEALAEKRRIEESLRITQNQIKHLEGIIPICMHCKKIRTDSDMWLQVEQYVTEHSEAEFSHGICPACLEQYYPEYK